MSVLQGIRSSVKDAFSTLKSMGLCRQVVYKVFVEGSYNATTGERASSYSQIDISAIITEFTDQEVKAGIATRRDRRVLILAENLSGYSISEQDAINFDGKDWNLFKSEKDPTSTVFEFFAKG